MVICELWVINKEYVIKYCLWKWTTGIDCREFVEKGCRDKDVHEN